MIADRRALKTGAMQEVSGHQVGRGDVGIFASAGDVVGGLRARMRRLALMAMAALLPFQMGHSQPRARDIAQYTHIRWSQESDPPVPVFSLTQDSKGFLWVGAALGLYRFDGLTFYPVELPAKVKGSALAVHAARNGDVWVNFAGSLDYYVYRDGRLHAVPSLPGTEGIVTKFAEESDGTIWAGMGEHAKGLLRYREGRWTHFSEKQGLPLDELLGLEVARDGSIWASFQNSVVRLPKGTARFERVLATPGGGSRIDQDREGRIWLSDIRGIRPITGPGGIGRPPPLRHAYRLPSDHAQGDIQFDRQDNLWISLWRDGLRRIAKPDPSGARTAADAAAALEFFRTSDGLTSSNIRQPFEDREGNIWVPTEAGLDKFRPASFWVEKSLVRTAMYNDVMLAATSGDVFIAQRDAVYRVTPGGNPAPILRNRSEPQAMCEGPDGMLWVAYGDQILAWQGGAVRKTYRAPATTTGFEDCAVDSRGRLLVSAAKSGLFRLEGDRLVPVAGSAGQGDASPSFLQVARGGGIAIGWSANQLAWVDQSGALSRRLTVGGKDDSLRTAFASGDELLVAGSFGLARIAGGKVRTIASDRFEAAAKIRGIVEAPDGYTWLASQVALYRVPSADLERAFSDPAFTPRILKLDETDGQPGRIGVQSARALVRGGDGRLWMTTAEGISWVDPAQLVRNPVAPKAAILSVTAGSHIYSDPAALKLPGGTADLKFDFSLLSLANPKQNRARYRLIGHDSGWIDPEQRREAFYTNLAPGSYRFIVTGANSDGTWSEKGASVAIEIAPTFRQSGWFLAICGASILLLLFGLHRARLAQVATAVRRRLEERLSERERIARELHDTLFQSVQGLVLHVQAVVNRMSAENPDRARLAAALTDADKVIAEGRDILSDLRDADGSTDLKDVIEATLLDREKGKTPLRMDFLGDVRRVNPLVGSEVARVIREAVANARLHSGGERIDVTVLYDPDELHVRIADDGKGWPEEVLAQGSKAGRYGLVGMRERAARIGGTLSLEASENGAAVVMKVPGRIAYVAGRTEQAAAPAV